MKPPIIARTAIVTSDATAALPVPSVRMLSSADSAEAVCGRISVPVAVVVAGSVVVLIVVTAGEDGFTTGGVILAVAIETCAESFFSVVVEVAATEGTSGRGLDKLASARIVSLFRWWPPPLLPLLLLVELVV